MFSIVLIIICLKVCIVCFPICSCFHEFNVVFPSICHVLLFLSSLFKVCVFVQAVSMCCMLFQAF